MHLGLSVEPSTAAAHTLWQADIVARHVEVSGDPDRVLGRWLSEGTPVGVAQAIEPSGVFPQAEYAVRDA